MKRDDHPRFAELSLLADGDLPAAETMRTSAHLSSCRKCRDTLGFMEELRERLRRMPSPSPSDSVWERIVRHRSESAGVHTMTS